MREVEFRGRRLDNGEWVYGDLIQYREKDCRILTQNAGKWDILEAADEVDPATVGQYLERKDDTGTKIYEGDVVNVWGGEHWYGGWEHDEVWMLNDFFENRFMMGEVENIQVIGNIHDNPELLK